MRKTKKDDAAIQRWRHSNIHKADELLLGTSTVSMSCKATGSPCPSQRSSVSLNPKESTWRMCRKSTWQRRHKAKRRHTDTAGTGPGSNQMKKRELQVQRGLRRSLTLIDIEEPKILNCLYSSMKMNKEHCEKRILFIAAHDINIYSSLEDYASFAQLKPCIECSLEYCWFWPGRD